MFNTHYLRYALTPRSIAVVGATDRQEALGNYVFGNALGAGFRGDIYPINPKHEVVAGQRCYASLQALPAAVDLAVIVTPAQTVPAIIDDAARRRIGAVLVLSAGFAEMGGAGRQLQQLAVARARAQGIRLLGPNCLGVMRPDIGFNATSARTAARPGSVALVSQSGAVMAALLDYAWSAGFGFSSAVSTGAGADVDFPEVLDFLANDPVTRSIVLYIEGVHDSRALMSSVRAAASTKPVVVLKVGRHLTGRKAAMSHTGASVGDDAVFDVALKRAGAIRVGAYNQLFAAAEALAAGRLPDGEQANRLVVLTNGGGPGVLAADAAADADVALATLSDAVKQRLDAVLPPTWSRGNPVDIVGDADAQRFASSFRILLEDPDNDGVLVLFSPLIRLEAEAAAKALLELAAASTKPVISVWLGAHDAGRGGAVFKAAGLPALTSPERGVESFSYLARYVRHRRWRLQVPPSHSDEFEIDLGRARSEVSEALQTGRATLDERESKRLLDCFGIPTVAAEFAATPEDAVRHAGQVGFPVVVKVVASGVAHKSEVEGVQLDLRSADEVIQAFATIKGNVAARAPRARFLGVHVQAMVERPRARELIVGIARDAQFGPVIGFGMGGIGVDVYGDLAVALPPLNRFLAQQLIAATRVSRMLGEFRGRPVVAQDALVDTLLKVSELACELPCIDELDINPLLADENGVLALDARVVLGSGPLAADASYSHLAIHPYPKNLWRAVRLRNGDMTLLRPIRPEDAAAEQRFIARLSQRSLYLRFHGLVRELSLERLIRFTQIDYDREMAFVATDMQGDAEEIRGIARYTRNPDGASCEFAIVIEDAWQARGLGAALMTALEACARGRGLREMIGFVLAENNAMAQMMIRLGYEGRPEPDDPTVVRFAKGL
ncbi:MAG TPA: bifunctional acetate--CoA ligase family protein/GNAT family N-acetyltransferase [Burkholderiaceae bacterium]|nr:bifunctional acetate--CoA ligase family protein/GNAT family N-acetyltransferase [Burkholderiaceae bacterium]